MKTIYVAPRPISIDGCQASWSEKYVANTIRTEMDDMEVKVRRRSTGMVRTINKSVKLKASVYDDFVKWFEVNQQGGVVPTSIKRPQDSKEIIVRVKEPPQISWVEKDVFEAQMVWETMPAWKNLVVV